MPARNIHLTKEWDEFVSDRVDSGRYANASEVVRAGLRALEEDEKEDQVKLKALREAIRAGEESGIYEGDPWAEIDRMIDRYAREQNKERKTA